MDNDNFVIKHSQMHKTRNNCFELKQCWRILHQSKMDKEVRSIWWYLFAKFSLIIIQNSSLIFFLLHYRIFLDLSKNKILLNIHWHAVIHNISRDVRKWFHNLDMMDNFPLLFFFPPPPLPVMQISVINLLLYSLIFLKK